MNTPAETASARVFLRVLGRTLWRGGAASRPFLARTSLAETFVRPALRALAAAGVEVRLGHTLRRLNVSRSRAGDLEFDDQVLHLGRKDCVVLAVSWPVAAGLLGTLPDLPSSPIVNAHFRLSAPPSHLSSGGFLGLLGGCAHWLFLRGDVLSVTVSAATDLAERPVGEVGDRLWRDAATALDLPGSPSSVRVIKEKRATLLHSPEVEARRPPPRAGDNLFLAGDWTATGLPCTLEGAICSGRTAAGLVRRFSETW